jgi:hypothetical protein
VAGVAAAAAATAAAAEVWSPDVVDWTCTQKLHLAKNKDKLSAFTAAHAAFNSAVDTAAASADESKRVLGIAAGAAKAGRLLLFADALMKWRGNTAQFAEQITDSLAACASKCTDVAAFAAVLRACVLLTAAGLPDSSSDVQDSLQWVHLWHQAAAFANDSTIHNLRLPDFFHLCRLLVKNTMRPQSRLLAFYLDPSSRAAIVKNLARRGAPVLASYYIEKVSFDGHYGYASDTVTLVQQVARRGRTDVLDHLYDRGVLNDARTVSAMHSGAIEGDTVVAVQWLAQHGMLQTDFRAKLVPCHRKVLAYFAGVDTTTAVAAAAAAADTTA